MRNSKTHTVLALLVLVGVGSVSCHGDKQPKLTELQTAKLRLAQQDAIIVKQQLDQVQNQFNVKVGAFNELCEAIKRSDKWPAYATCDIVNATITIPQTPPPTAQAAPTSAPAAATQKAPAKNK